MPFIVTTTHTIPDDAPVTAGMLSDVLRPSRWAGLPVGTASTARVDFVPARPVAPSTARNREVAAATVLRDAARAVGLQPGTVNHMPPGDALNFRHPRDPDAAFRG